MREPDEEEIGILLRGFAQGMRNRMMGLHLRETAGNTGLQVPQPTREWFTMMRLPLEIGASRAWLALEEHRTDPDGVPRYRTGGDVF